MTTLPAPATVAPSEPVLDLCVFLAEAACDLSQQAAAAWDSDEVLGKLDDMRQAIEDARSAYLAAVNRGAL